MLDMSKATPDTSSLCDSCLNLQFVGEFMVGTVESGGPEEFFMCEKGHDCSRYNHDLFERGCKDYDPRDPCEDY